MDDIRESKRKLRNDIVRTVSSLSENDKSNKIKQIENRLFTFANFREANIALLYISRYDKFDIKDIVKKSIASNKISVLPAFDDDKKEMTLMKIDNIDTGLIAGPNGFLEPDPGQCKTVPHESIDIAIIPGLAFDEKGGRIGVGEGYYDRLLPKLPITTRKVVLAFEEQIVPLVPMESHDKYVDIIITDQRIIYKI
ncbi:MAG: 5-formyltetrahydrofolate cyclo-ligase [Deltaproteobacteria bacterium]|nr:5-formyltetrahydrofolate cyclo-ligase [Deltaproteobacteria bacterium]